MSNFFPEDGFYMDPDTEPLPDHLSIFNYDNTWAIWPVIFMGVIIYLILSEIGSQDCTTQNCNNKLPVLNDDDTSVEMIDKINEALRKLHRTVTWRLSMICAIIISVFILAVFYMSKMISGIVFFILVLTIFFIIAACFSWFNAHFHRQNSYKEEQTLYELRHKVQQRNKPTIDETGNRTKDNIKDDLKDETVCETIDQTQDDLGNNFVSEIDIFNFEKNNQEYDNIMNMFDFQSDKRILSIPY